MKVLYVNQTGQMSGAERSLMTLLDGLAGSVEEVLACPPGELSAAAVAAAIDAIPIRGTQASFRLHLVQTTRGLLDIARSARELRRIMSRTRPDLVHANTTRAALLALAARRRGGPPVIAQIRDWVPDGRFSRFVLRFIAKRADAIVANSRYVARLFDGLPVRRPVLAIHNPVDFSELVPGGSQGEAVRRELGLDAQAVVLAVVAQITPWKAQDDAIRTVAELVSAGRAVDLLLVGSAKFGGEGTQYDNLGFERELRALAVELGVAERVQFLGERDDVGAVLAATDVLLLPSWREAFGRIAVEAMAMEVPVVATDIGGPPEIVRADLDGLLLAPRQPALWAQKLQPLVDDREMRRAMGRSGRGRALEFSSEVHAAAVLALYRELIAGP